MFELDKIFKILIQEEITFEELGILYTLHYKNVDSSILKLANQYYKQNNVYKIYKGVSNVLYVDIIDRLVEKGLIHPYDKSEENKVNFNVLRLTQKFINAFFVSQNDAYEYVKTLYPSWLEYKDNSTGKYKKVSTFSINHDEMKLYFFKEILKGGQKVLFDRFCYITKELFGYKEEFDTYGNFIGGKPTIEPTTKFDKYLREYELHAKEFENPSSDDTIKNKFL